jgi:hypothetical protein
VRRFPPPWSVEEQAAWFVVRDANRQARHGSRPTVHRYADVALDLCDELGWYVPGGKVKLDEVSKILGSCQRF